MDELKHARLSASGSDQWLYCPGSINACEGIPKPTSKFAEEGTLAHDAAANHLINGTSATEFEEIPIQNYIEYVRALLAPDSILFVEKRVDFSDWVKDGFGTTDAAIIDEQSQTCHIIDLKYGKGVPVYADDNNQMRIYALGMLKEFPNLTQFHLHIVQPRINNYSKTSLSISELLLYAEWIKGRSLLTEGENAPRIAGDKQCRWCSAKSNCKVLLDYSQAVVTAEFDSLPEVSSLSNAQLTRIMDNKDLIRGFLTAVEETVFEKVSMGDKSLPFKLISKTGNRSWADNAEEVLVSKLGEEAYIKKMIGLGVAEKKLGKAFVSEITIKGKDSIALVPLSDKRSAIVSFDE